MQDPFADLSLEQIQNREKLARELYPVLWWVTELVMFIRSPWTWVRGWYRRRQIRYDAD